MTSKLTHNHMRCDNHCPRCGAKDETINHAIFECLPILQIWTHVATPTPPLVFSSASHFTNMDYLFWRKNDIEDPELDKDSYPWIICIFGKQEITNCLKGWTWTH